MLGYKKINFKKKPNNLIFSYDNRHDILEISIGKPVPSFSDEEHLKGLYIRRSIDGGKITGATVMDYSKRNKNILKKYIPFKVDFNSIS